MGYVGHSEFDIHDALLTGTVAGVRAVSVGRCIWNLICKVRRIITALM